MINLFRVFVFLRNNNSEKSVEFLVSQNLLTQSKYFLVFQEDINQFWKLQEGRQPVVVENAHNIIAAAAVHFNEVTF